MLVDINSLSWKLRRDKEEGIWYRTAIVMDGASPKIVNSNKPEDRRFIEDLDCEVSDFGMTVLVSAGVVSLRWNYPSFIQNLS